MAGPVAPADRDLSRGPDGDSPGDRRELELYAGRPGPPRGRPARPGGGAVGGGVGAAGGAAVAISPPSARETSPPGPLSSELERGDDAEPPCRKRVLPGNVPRMRSPSPLRGEGD